MSAAEKVVKPPAEEEEEVDLDEMLDDALDDFEDDQPAPAPSAAAAASASSSSCAQATKELNPEMLKLLEEATQNLDASQENEMETLRQNMNKFLEDAQRPEFQEVLEQAFRELDAEGTAGGENGENIKSLLGSLKADESATAAAATPSKPSPPTQQEDDSVEAGVAKTLQNMSRAAEEMEGLESAKVEQMGEEMMEEMMKKFEQMGEKNDFQDLVDGMMRQLLSKDVMYDPMKQICEKYPEWLAEKEPLLPKEEYEKYGKQYQYFQRILAVYETEPDNFARISELMQELQDCGQPPSEIIKNLAPGLQFDEEGMPLMPNMGAGMFPGMAGLPGMPLGNPGAPGQEQCCVM